MNFNLLPSLERLALIKVASTAWNSYDIKTYRLYLCTKIKDPLLVMVEVWRIESEIRTKVAQLVCPQTLKIKILDFIGPIGFQIRKWLHYHDVELKLHPYEWNHPFCFTSLGTVDRKKIAEVLIKDEYVGICGRYIVACINCLEHDIIKLWNRVPENFKIYFYSKEDPKTIKQQKLVIFWTYYITGEVARLDSMIEREWCSSAYQFAFECAVQTCNKVATQYFFKKLNDEERKVSLVRCVGRQESEGCCPFDKADYFDVTFFLLSQMNAEQQIEVFKRRFEDFCYTLFCSSYKSNSGCPYIFREFWERSPDTFKKDVMDKCATCDFGLIFKLFKVGDMEKISLVLKSATLAEKERIIFSFSGANICKYLVDKSQWGLLMFFICECIASQEKMIKFKEKLKDFVKEMGKNEVKLKWEHFFRLLDDVIFCYGERKNIEGHGNPAKKLRTEGTVHSAEKEV